MKNKKKIFIGLFICLLIIVSSITIVLIKNEKKQTVAKTETLEKLSGLRVTKKDITEKNGKKYYNYYVNYSPYIYSEDDGTNNYYDYKFCKLDVSGKYIDNEEEKVVYSKKLDNVSFIMEDISIESTIFNNLETDELELNLHHCTESKVYGDIEGYDFIEEDYYKYIHTYSSLSPITDDENQSDNKITVKASYDTEKSNSSTAYYNISVSQTRESGNPIEEIICSYKGCTVSEYRNYYTSTEGLYSETIKYERKGYPQFIYITYGSTTVSYLVQAKGASGPACIANNLGDIYVNGYINTQAECYSELGFDTNSYLKMYTDGYENSLYKIESKGDDEFKSLNGTTNNYYRVGIKITGLKGSDYGYNLKITPSTSSLKDIKNNYITNTYLNGTWSSYLFNFNVIIEPIVEREYSNIIDTIIYNEEYSSEILCTGSSKECGQSNIANLLDITPYYYDINDNFKSYDITDKSYVRYELEKTKYYTGNNELYKNLQTYYYKITYSIGDLGVDYGLLSICFTHRGSWVNIQYIRGKQIVILDDSSYTIMAGNTLFKNIFTYSYRPDYYPDEVRSIRSNLEDFSKEMINVYKYNNDKYELAESSDYKILQLDKYGNIQIVFYKTGQFKIDFNYEYLKANNIITIEDIVKVNDVKNNTIEITVTDPEKPICTFYDSNNNVITDLVSLKNSNYDIKLVCVANKHYYDLYKNLVYDKGLDLNEKKYESEVIDDLVYNTYNLSLKSTSIEDKKIVLKQNTILNNASELSGNDEVTLNIKTITKPTCTINNGNNIVINSSSGINVRVKCSSETSAFNPITAEELKSKLSINNENFTIEKVLLYKIDEKNINFDVLITAKKSKESGTFAIPSNVLIDYYGYTTTAKQDISSKDVSAPVCEFDNLKDSTIQNGKTTTISLTCYDNYAIEVPNDITDHLDSKSGLLSNKLSFSASVESKTTNSIKYKITIKGNSTGSSHIYLNRNAVKDVNGNVNGRVEGPEITIKLLPVKTNDSK